MPSLVEAIDRLIGANAALRKRQALTKPERALQTAMATAFQEQARAFLARLTLVRHLFPPAVREVAEPIPWEPLFDDAALATVQAFQQPISEVTAKALASGMLAAVADLDVTTSFTLEHPAAVAFLRQRHVDALGEVTETTRNRLRTILIQAADEGWSYDRTAKAIRARFADFSRERARNIAVYETGNAYEHGNMLVATDLQNGGLVMQKSWLSVGDDRVRPDHRANQAQGWIGLNETFQDGSDRPPADPRCRCTLLMRRQPNE